MSLEISGQDWGFTNSIGDSAPSFPEDAGPDQEYDIILTDQGWSFIITPQGSPPTFPEDAGADQEYDVVLWGYGWMYKISNSMGAPNILTWQRFIEDEDRHQTKLSSRSLTAYGSHKKSIVLKVRKKG